MQLDAVAVHHEAQQRIAVLQSADRKHPGFPAHRDEVAAQLFPVFADVPRERIRSGRGLFAGLAAVGAEQLRIGGHILQKRGRGQVREGRDVRLDRSVGYPNIFLFSGVYARMGRAFKGSTPLNAFFFVNRYKNNRKSWQYR